MSSPLFRVDVDSRQPGIKSMRRSKILNPRMTSSIGITGRHNPFSVSATGSPRYTAASLPSRSSGTSPAIASKIPRKGQTPTQEHVSRATTNSSGATQQQPIIPRSCSGHRAPMKDSPSHLDVKRLSLTYIRDKPLPSPPLAQVIDPNSPLNAQRTLIDAEVGSPTDEEWPILRPENASPLDESAVSQQRSVSEGSKLLQFTRPDIKAKMTEPSTPSKARIEIPTSPAGAGGVSVMQTMSQGLDFNSTCLNRFHAISTGSESVMESPLAHKKSTPMLIPPRISSKRSPLPLLSDNTQQTPILPSSVTIRHIKPPGSTKWSVLELNDVENLAVDKPSSVPDQLAMTVCTAGLQPHDGQDLHVVPEPVGSCNTVQSQYGSIDSNSTWSMDAGFSLSDEPHNDTDYNIRTKRLSWHSTAFGKVPIRKSGPLLIIDGDADAILLGSSDSIPKIPALPEQTPEQPPPLRSLTASTERIHDQSIVETSLDNLSRKSTPSSRKNGIITNSLAKINPIRSMQPPRKASVETFIGRRSSSNTPTSLNPEKITRLPMFSSITNRNASGFSKNVATTDVTLTGVESSPAYDFFDRSAKTVHEVCASLAFRNASVNEFKEKVDHAGPCSSASSDTKQDLNMKSEISPVPARAHLQDTLLLSTDECKAKQMSVDRSKIAPFLTSGRLGSLESASASVLSSPKPPIPHDAGHSFTGTFSPGPSKVSVTSNSSRCSRISVAKRPAPLGRAKQSSQSIHVSSSFTVKGSSAKESSHGITGAEDRTANKIETKRSFRDIFHKREVKRTDKPPKLANKKRSSMAGSALAKRFRNSTNSSDVNMVKTPESSAHPIHELISEEIPSKTATTDTKGRGAVFSSESASPRLAVEATPTIRHDTASVINKIIDRVSSMPSDSPDRLRGLEIAEVCTTLYARSLMHRELILTMQIKQTVLHAIECSREAKMSAEMAKKHARDAELHVERAGVELNRLQKLCEPDFDEETLMAINTLIKGVGLASENDVSERAVLSQ